MDRISRPWLMNFSDGPDIRPLSDEFQEWTGSGFCLMNFRNSPDIRLLSDEFQGWTGYPALSDEFQGWTGYPAFVWWISGIDRISRLCLLDFRNGLDIRPLSDEFQRWTWYPFNKGILSINSADVQKYNQPIRDRKQRQLRKSEYKERYLKIKSNCSFFFAIVFVYWYYFLFIDLVRIIINNNV